MTVVAFAGVLDPLQMLFPQFVDVMIKKHAPTCDNATKRSVLLSLFRSRLPASSFLLARWRPVLPQHPLFFPGEKLHHVRRGKFQFPCTGSFCGCFSSNSEEILYFRGSLLALTDDCCGISEVLDPRPIVFRNL